jgi:DDE family transposase
LKATRAPLLDRVRFVLPELASVGADQGFAAERVWDDTAERRLVASIPPQPTMLPPDRRGPRTNAQRLALAARARAKSDAGVWAYRRRMADAEGVIAEPKNQHGLDRVRCRGTPAFHVQLLPGCAAINLKRLAKYDPTAQLRIAAAPKAAAAELGAAGDQPPHDRPSATIRLGRGQLLWNTRPCLNRTHENPFPDTTLERLAPQTRGLP